MRSERALAFKYATALLEWVSSYRVLAYPLQQSGI